MRSALAILSVIVFSVLALGACGTNESSKSAAVGDFPVTVQNCGRDVTIDAPPGRVLTIGAEAPTLVAAAGGADRIVARSGEYGSPLGQYESALQAVPQVTTNADNPSTEAIIAQDADLVITRGSEDASALQSVGIERLVIGGRCRGADDKVTAAGTLEEVYSDIELYGRLFGTQDAAAASVADLRKRVTAVEEQFQDRPQRRAAAVIYSGGGEQLGSYGGLSVVHQQMNALGLTNVFGDAPERFFEPTIEELIARDPEVFVLLFENNVGTAESFRAKIVAQPGLSDVSAIRNGDVVVIPFALSASSPNSVLGLEMLAGQLNDLS